MSFPQFFLLVDVPEFSVINSHAFLHILLHIHALLKLSLHVLKYILISKCRFFLASFFGSCFVVRMKNGLALRIPSGEYTAQFIYPVNCWETFSCFGWFEAVTADTRFHVGATSTPVSVGEFP